MFRDCLKTQQIRSKKVSEMVFQEVSLMLKSVVGEQIERIQKIVI